MNNRWKEDWEEYVKWIAAAYSDGKEGEEVSKLLSGQRVVWAGVVARVKVAENIAPSLTMKMKHAHCVLSDGYVLDAEHLSLPVRSPETKEKATALKAGCSIEFEATVQKLGGLFPPFKFMRDVDQEKIFAVLALEDVVLRSVNGKRS